MAANNSTRTSPTPRCRACGAAGGREVLRLAHEERVHTVVRFRACQLPQAEEGYGPVSRDYFALGAQPPHEEHLWCQGEHELSAPRRWRRHAAALLSCPVRGLPDGHGWATREHVFCHSSEPLALIHRQAGLIPVRAGVVACCSRPLSVLQDLRRDGFLLLGAVPSVLRQIYPWSRRGNG